MNETQKKVLLGSISTFLLTAIYVPERLTHSNGATTHEGWSWIWDISFDLHMNLLLVEWAAIAVVGVGLFFYFKK